MTFALLSCTDNLDPKLSEVLAKEIKDRGAKVAYISSSPQEEPFPYYHSTIADYKAIDEAIEVAYFDLSSRFSDADLAKLRDYGSIYLSGGNMFAFLDAARKRNLYPILKACADAGGLLIGASAGSIILTPSVKIADDEDENNVGMTDFTGFHFVDFEFYPHWQNTLAQREYVERYQRAHSAIHIYTCVDGGGIFIEKGGVRLFGNTSIFA